jgi:hypothetical protein
MDSCPPWAAAAATHQACPASPAVSSEGARLFCPPGRQASDGAGRRAAGPSAAGPPRRSTRRCERRPRASSPARGPSPVAPQRRALGRAPSTPRGRARPPETGPPKANPGEEGRGQGARGGGGRWRRLAGRPGPPEARLRAGPGRAGPGTSRAGDTVSVQDRRCRAGPGHRVSRSGPARPPRRPVRLGPRLGPPPATIRVMPPAAAIAQVLVGEVFGQASVGRPAWTSTRDPESESVGCPGWDSDGGTRPRSR